MCAVFNDRLTNAHELTMRFNTSTLNTAQTCSCTFGPKDNCQRNREIVSNYCLLSNNIRASVNFVDNRILSCERGHIKLRVYDRNNWATNYTIIRNRSDIWYAITAKVEYSITQYSAHGNDHMEGFFSLISKWI